MDRRVPFSLIEARHRGRERSAAERWDGEGIEGHRVLSGLGDVQATNRQPWGRVANIRSPVLSQEASFRFNKLPVGCCEL
jgi:hypothetical protein